MSSLNLVHYVDDGRTPCGRPDFAAIASELRSDVTCRRCLASLAKRDREFRAKARRWFGDAGSDLAFGFDRPECLSEPFCACGRVISRCDSSRRGCAARAIAREEGRT